MGAAKNVLVKGGNSTGGGYSEVVKAENAIEVAGEMAAGNAPVVQPDGSVEWATPDGTGDTAALEAQQTAMYKAMSYPNTFINGDGAVHQGNEGEVTLIVSAPYFGDGFKGQSTGFTTGAAVGARNLDSLTPPDDFNNYYGVKITTTQVPSGTAYQCTLRQDVEGTRMIGHRWSMAADYRKPVLLSFKIQATKSGTIPVALREASGSASYVKGVTINSANTWEFKYMVIPAPTIGTWGGDENKAAIFGVTLGAGADFQAPSEGWNSGNYQTLAGSTEYLTTADAVYITGVQMYPLDYKLLNGQLVDYTSSEGEIVAPVRPFMHDSITGATQDCKVLGEYKRSRSTYGRFGNGQALSSTQAYITVQHGDKRSGAWAGILSGSFALSNGTAILPVTSYTLASRADGISQFTVTCGGGGLTTNASYTLVSNNDANAYVFIDDRL